MYAKWEFLDQNFALLTKNYLYKKTDQTELNPNCNAKRTRTEPNFNSNQTEQNTNLNLWVRFPSLLESSTPDDGVRLAVLKLMVSR